MAGNVIIKNAQGKTVTLRNPDSNMEDKVIEVDSLTRKDYVDNLVATVTNTANKSPNGWFKDEKTGLIIQWGSIAIGDIVDANYHPVNFPISFPNACLNIIASSGETGAGKWDLFIHPSPSVSQFQYATLEYQAVVQNASFKYMAIGY